MRFRVRLPFFILLLVCAVCIRPLSAQRAPNANAYYQQLRSLLPAGEVITVKDLVLQRDAATFELGGVVQPVKVNHSRPVNDQLAPVA